MGLRSPGDVPGFFFIRDLASDESSYFAGQWLSPNGGLFHATRAAYVYVFPFGQTPAGISRDTHATVGNHSPKVVRDGSGALHVVWLDAGRPGVGPRVMYRRGIQDPSIGCLRWQTEPLR